MNATRNLMLCVSIAVLSIGDGIAQEAFSTTGKIERLDPALNALIPADAKIEVLAEGFEWSEGPVWIKEADGSGFVVFSDVPTNKVHRWKEGEGLSVYLEPSGFTAGGTRPGELGSNGLTTDAKGSLLLCQHGDRRIARMTSPTSAQKPQYETVVDNYDGKKFNSPNDLAIARDGTIYFTDPIYGLVKREEDPSREIDFCGVYRVKPGGKAELVDDGLPRPNGIALSPDEKTLYVAQSHGAAPIYQAYALGDDGSIGEGKIVFNAKHLTADRRGMPDGIKVDTAGNIWGTGPGGVLIISPEGKHLGSILTGQRTANCAFGGPDGKILYMTCDGFLMRLRTNAKGATVK